MYLRYKQQIFSYLTTFYQESVPQVTAPIEVLKKITVQLPQDAWQGGALGHLDHLHAGYLPCTRYPDERR